MLKFALEGVHPADLDNRVREILIDKRNRFDEDIPCWHADSDRLNEIPELATIRQMEQR